jgi:hypothetical protein
MSSSAIEISAWNFICSSASNHQHDSCICFVTRVRQAIVDPRDIIVTMFVGGQSQRELEHLQKHHLGPDFNGVQPRKRKRCSRIWGNPVAPGCGWPAWGKLQGPPFSAPSFPPHPLTSKRPPFLLPANFQKYFLSTSCLNNF